MGLLSRLAVKGAKKAATKAAEEAAEKGVKRAASTAKRNPMAVKALPAPPKVLALPAPGPGLPEFAVKRKGGQWWPNTRIGDGFSEGRNYSPEYAVETELNRRFVGDLAPEEQTLRSWFEKAAPRYIRNELGTPEDPMMRLAEQGNLHLADVTPSQWARRTRMSLYNEPIGYFTVPDTSVDPELGVNLNFGPDQKEVDQLLAAAPWLRKAPVTDELYGLTQGAGEQLGFGHILDELNNAMNPNSGLPPELLLRPESLGRMSLAAAAERVGRINQFRVKQAEQAALSAIDNPATHLFKEYPENNPMGLRWVELRAPEGTPPYQSPYGLSHDELAAALEEPAHPGESALREALKYEGDTMGHCVGGYCPDVLQGRSRIFSLRDAKGEPHVTIETRPGGERRALNEIPRDVLDELTADAMADTNAVTGPMGISMDDPRWAKTYQTNLGLKQREWIASNPLPDEIVQIKGKQNRAPKDTYLPFVQDFVKSQNWANIGDMENTGLVRLPDGRYITAQQAEEGIAAIPETTTMQRAWGSREMVPMRRVYNPTALDQIDPEEWNAIAPYFQGYAIGGRVDPDRCFCRHPMAVKR